MPLEPMGRAASRPVTAPERAPRRGDAAFAMDPARPVAVTGVARTPQPRGPQ